MYEGAFMGAMFNGYWLVFGIILVPVYGMVLGWFFGKPRNYRWALVGVGYLIGTIVVMWTGLFVFAEVLRLLFF